MHLPRLRQVVLAAHDLDAVAQQLEQSLGVHNAFHDVGVGHFGLRNAVYALGDCFIEVVSPERPDTAAGRQLQRRGGNCGYMAMFEVADEQVTRKRLEAQQVRVIWDTTHDDIVDLHLHPKDVPTAIVALDVTNPVGSWRWGGPEWTAQVPAHGTGGITGLTVAARDPEAVAAKWAAVLGVSADRDRLRLAGGGQEVRFVPADNAAEEGIVGVGARVPTDVGIGSVHIGGVAFDRAAAKE